LEEARRRKARGNEREKAQGTEAQSEEAIGK